MNILEDFQFPNWIEFFDNDIDYYSNKDRQDLLCRFKLRQIYHNFCVARMNVIFSEDKTNYGDLDPEGKNKKMLKNLFLQNALIYYNTCIDLSWCLVYFYCVSKKDEEFNISMEEIKKIEDSINFDSLQEILKCQINISSIKEKSILEKLLNITNDFWIKNLPNDFRQDYNYIKHKGVFDIFGFESNNSELFLVNGKTPNIVIPRIKSFDSDKYMKILQEFHIKFIKYIDDIIDVIIKPKCNQNIYPFEEIMTNIINNLET